jgi:hypothetical protein
MEETTNKSANSALIEERLKRLDKKNFDWSSWKKGTLLVLEKIFGKDSLYVKELENTDYHYNSWSLRDTAGSEDPVRASVQELLNICLTDAEHQPENAPETRDNATSKQIKEIVKQFLDNATLAEIAKIADSNAPSMTKEEHIQNLIKEKLPRHQEVMLGKIILEYFSA